MSEKTEQLLTEILAVLQKIENHLTPKIWLNTQPYEISDGGTGDWNDNAPYQICDDWKEIVHQPLTDTAGCGCEKCRPPQTAGGCFKCGCKYVAVYNEDGTWLCNKCK